MPGSEPSPFLTFTREEWSRLHGGTPMTLTSRDVEEIGGIDEQLSLTEVEKDLETWFLDRFRKLRDTAFRDPRSFFHDFAAMPEGEAVARARDVWTRINLANLRENIAPTRDRARLILEKGPSHEVERVRLRRL